MLRVESTHDAFTVFLSEKPIIAHSVKHPCLFAGSAENVIRQKRGAFRHSGRGSAISPLRSFDIRKADDGFVLVAFEGGVRMEVRLASGFACKTAEIRFFGFPTGSNRFRYVMPAHPLERFYGCGEQFRKLGLKGRRIPLWVEDQGPRKVRGPFLRRANPRGSSRAKQSSSYLPLSSWISSERCFTLVETQSYSVADFRKRCETSFSSWGIPARIVVGVAPDMEKCLSALNAVSGRQEPLPPWTYDGMWLGATGGWDALEAKLATARDSGVKVGALWVRDWHERRECGNASSWKADEGRYPDFPARLAALKARGLRFFGYVAPFLSTEGDLYREASPAGYCVRHPEGGDYFVPVSGGQAAIVDLTNPRAFAWIKDIIKREMIAAGMSGWIADLGEHFPVDGIAFSKADGEALHNAYPLLWARVNREAIDECRVVDDGTLAERGSETDSRRGDIVFFVRSGWTGINREGAAFFSGAQFSSLEAKDGFASVVPAALSLSMSGTGNWHSELGGSVNVPWRKRGVECLLRWAEHSAFSPLMRSGEGAFAESGAGIRSKPRPKDPNAQIWSSPDTLRHIARMTDIFTSLKPYHEAVARELGELGLPQLRHPALHYEDDPELHRLQDQYLYGRDLFVAPAVRAKKELREVFLPSDEWIHLWSSREFRGGWVSIEAPLGYPAVFYRAHSPFAPLFDSIRKTVRKF